VLCEPSRLKRTSLLCSLWTSLMCVAPGSCPCRIDWFEGVGNAPRRGWLRVDVSIECDTQHHENAKLLSWAAVLMYPIGLWCFTLVLLRKVSADIFAGKPTPFSRSCAFLYDAYKVPTFWWELMEMARKFLLIGLFVTIEPGTVMQIAIGTITSAAYFVRRPLRDGCPRRAIFVRAPLMFRISHRQMIQLKAQPYKSLTECVTAPRTFLGYPTHTQSSVDRVSPTQRRPGAISELVFAHALLLLRDLQVRLAHGI
jgi:hypothetical protein